MMLRRKKALCAVLTGIIAGMPLLAAAEVSMTASGGNDRIRIHGNLDTQEAKEFVIKVLKGIDTALTEETAVDQLPCNGTGTRLEASAGILRAVL